MKTLTAAQWQVVADNQALIGTHLRRLKLTPSARDRLHVKLQNLLEYAVSEWDSSKTTLSTYFYRAANRCLARFLQRERLEKANHDRLCASCADSYLDSAAPAETSSDYRTAIEAVEAAAKALQLSPERTTVAIAVLRGELTLQAAGDKLEMTKEGARKIVKKLQQKAAYLVA